MSCNRCPLNSPRRARAHSGTPRRLAGLLPVPTVCCRGARCRACRGPICGGLWLAPALCRPLSPPPLAGTTLLGSLGRDSQGLSELSAHRSPGRRPSGSRLLYVFRLQRTVRAFTGTFPDYKDKMRSVTFSVCMCIYIIDTKFGSVN